MLLVQGAVGCFGLSQTKSVRVRPGYDSKVRGPIFTGPEQETYLSSFDRSVYAGGGVVLGLGAIYSFIMPWIHRKRDNTAPASSSPPFPSAVAHAKGLEVLRVFMQDALTYGL
jgi:hypothetical protein